MMSLICANVYVICANMYLIYTNMRLLFASINLIYAIVRLIRATSGVQLDHTGAVHGAIALVLREDR